jgi:hypothetical protein
MRSCSNGSIRQWVGGGVWHMQIAVDLRDADDFDDLEDGISRSKGFVAGVSLMQANGHHEL